MKSLHQTGFNRPSMTIVRSRYLKEFIMDVPTYVQASKRRVNGLASPLDVFVTNHEPKMYTDIECQEWRQELDKAISWSVDEMTNKLESEHRALIRKLRISCVILILGVLFWMVGFCLR